MSSSSPARPRPRGALQAGFTLLEVLVASAILGMTVSAVVVMVGNSDALRSSNDHNRQARIIAQEELEDPAHHFLNYDGMAGFIVPQPIDLDYQEPDQAATGALRTLTVAATQATLSDGVIVPFKRVVSSVGWSEGGRNVSVTLARRVVKTR